MKVRLTVEAPIRVGGREQQINKLEYVRYRGKLHAVSPRKLAALLQSKSERTLKDWSNEVLTRGQRADLTRFLTDRDLLDPDAVAKISRYSSHCDIDRLNEFHPHARDAFGRLFIPGSAIKGAIRTAVMYSLVDKNRANDYVASKGGGGRFYARNLDRDVMQSYELPERNLKPGPHFDLLRSVKVSDGYGKLESRVDKITIQSYTESGRGRTASLGASDTIYVECLTPGSWVEFDLKVDEKIRRDFERKNPGLPFADEEGLLSLVGNFYAEVWSRERRYYHGEAQEVPASTEPVSNPSLEEWVEQKTGRKLDTFSRRGIERRKLETEYRNIFVYGEEPVSAELSKTSVPGIQDGEVKVGRIKDFYKVPCPGFRLGWGSGLFSTTVDMRLDDDPMGKVLNLISSTHHDTRPIDGPKSRKLVGTSNTPRYPMGWARLEVKG